MVRGRWLEGEEGDADFCAEACGKLSRTRPSLGG